MAKSWLRSVMVPEEEMHARSLMNTDNEAALAYALYKLTLPSYSRLAGRLKKFHQCNFLLPFFV